MFAPLKQFQVPNSIRNLSITRPPAASSDGYITRRIKNEIEKKRTHVE